MVRSIFDDDIKGRLTSSSASRQRRMSYRMGLLHTNDMRSIEVNSMNWWGLIYWMQFIRYMVTYSHH